MSRRIVRRREARSDVISIASYIAEDSSAAGRRFMDAVEQAYKRLANMPRIGVEQAVRNSGLIGLRRLSVPGFRSFLIFYLPHDDGIEIVRVLHGARDYDKLFGG